MTRFHEPLLVGLKLVITLRYLATGDSCKNLMHCFKVAVSSISLFMPDVCEAIYQIYREEQLKFQSTPQERCEKAVHFGHRWNFYHAVGALDGPHVAIRCPRQSGSKHYNYKAFYSVVMLALVDAQIFNKCQLEKSLVDGTIGFPDADPLPGDEGEIPHFVVSDDAFTLRTWLMKPFSGRNLNEKKTHLQL